MNWISLVVVFPALVTVWKLGVVPEGQFVPSKRHTAVLLIKVFDERRVEPVIARVVPVVFVPVALPQVNSVGLNPLKIFKTPKVPMVAKALVAVTLVAVTFPNSAFQRSDELPRERVASLDGIRSLVTLPETAKLVAVALVIVVSPKITVPEAFTFDVVIPP